MGIDAKFYDEETINIDVLRKAARAGMILTFISDVAFSSLITPEQDFRYYNSVLKKIRRYTGMVWENEGGFISEEEIESKINSALLGGRKM